MNEVVPSNTFRVGIVNALPPNSKVGGAEFTIREFISELHDMKYEIHFLTVASQETENLRIDDSHLDLGCFLTILPNRNIFKLFGERRNSFLRKVWKVVDLIPKHVFLVRKWIKKSQIDLLMIHNEYGFGFSIPIASRLTKIKTMKYIHDYSLGCVRSSRYNNGICIKTCLPCRPYEMFARQFVSDFYIGNSHHMIDWLIKTVQMRIETSSLVVNPPVKTLTGNLESKRIYRYGFIGRVAPEKGVVEVLEKLAALGEELYIAGNSNTAYAQLIASTHSNVHFLGFLESGNFLEQVEILVVPSLWSEPFGRVIVEGGLSGCKLVFPSHPGMMEAGNLTHVPKFIYEPNNDYAMLEALKSARNYQGVIDVLYESEVYRSQLVSFQRVIRNFLGDT
jgi:glycosyltransferase involved in cell wall biosynthesis